MLKLSRLCDRSTVNLPCIWYSNLNVLRRHKHGQAVKKWYQTLGVTEDCEDETLRLAFVHLAKRFHPDSGTNEASALRFSEIESAYRQIRKYRIEQKEEAEKSEVEEFDIKHKAPQHRHYLTYDVGIGTLNKRQRLYSIQRAQTAAENVMEHRLKKIQAEERNTLVGMDKQRARDIKTRYGMDRLVEDLIQEAMNRGEFSDLPGMGKPLKENAGNRNPYVDFTTHKLNQVLIENGFTPEWIQLSKEIREETQDLRKQLSNARNNFGLLPLNATDEAAWNNVIESFKVPVRRINNKIDKYNLLVPIMQKQMLHVKLDKLADEALSKPPIETNKKKPVKAIVDNESDTDIFHFIGSLLSKKSM